MFSLRSLIIILLISLGWTFSPYLEYFSDRPTQGEFTGYERLGLFTSQDGVDLLVSIDAEKDLRVFDVQAKITAKSMPLSWRLSPVDGDEFDIKNRNGVRVGSFGFADNNIIIISGVNGASEMQFQRNEKAPYKQHLIEYENNGVQLAATVFAPNKSGPSIGVVMIHGSGRSDRNNLWYIAQADYLARQGFTVLLPDKRGSGRSGGLWKTASSIDLAADANAAVEALSNMEELSISRIGLMGLSLGGHIAPAAASANENVAFVVNVVGSLTTFDENLTHESANLFRGHTPDILTPPLIFIANQVARARIPIWWFKNGSFDPKPYWTELKVPALIIWGEEDEHENVPVIRSTELLEGINIARSDPIELMIYPGMGHGLFDQTGWISEDYLSFLSAWMHQAGVGAAANPADSGEHI